MRKIILLATLITFVFPHDNSEAIDPREFYNYELKQHGRVVYRGQTNDLDRREEEHKRDGKKFTHLKKVGRAKTYDGVRKAEKESLRTYRKNHNGENPKYNKTNHG